jgi:hypothetical protein
MRKKLINRLLITSLLFSCIACICFLLFLLTNSPFENDIVTPDAKQPATTPEKSMIDCLEPVISTVKYVRADENKTAISVNMDSQDNITKIFTSQNKTSGTNLYLGNYDLEYFYKNEWHFIGKPDWVNPGTILTQKLTTLKPSQTASNSITLDKVNCSGINSKLQSNKVDFISGKYRYTIPTYSQSENADSTDPQVLESIFYIEFELK